MKKQEDKFRAWSDGSVVKIIGYSSRGSKFDSQNPHASSKPPVTPVEKRINLIEIGQR